MRNAAQYKYEIYRCAVLWFVTDSKIHMTKIVNVLQVILFDYS